MNNEFLTPNDINILKGNGLYVPQGMFLTAQAVSLETAGSTTVDFYVTQLLMDGRIQRHNLTLYTPTDRSLKVDSIALAQGWILSATAVNTSRINRRGELFVSLMATYAPYGASGGYPPYYTFFQTYIGSSQNASWNSGSVGRMEMSTEGKGYERIGQGYSANPAVGADFIETVPTNVQMRFRSAVIQIVTDANVATRSLAVYFRDSGGNNIIVVGPISTQTAGLTRRYIFGNFGYPMADNGANLFINIPPNIFLTAGCTWRTLLTNIQVGDAITVSCVSYEEWVRL